MGLLPDKVQALLLHADIGVEISVGFHINIGLIHIDIQVSIGTNLHLQGPPFGGYASVDIGVVGFIAYFGDQDNEKPLSPGIKFWKW
jgi:hypothetical protein